MVVQGKAPNRGVSGRSPMKLKAFKHLASNADDRFGTIIMSVHCRHMRLTECRSDFYISAPFCRTVAYQNDFFIVVFHVRIICHQLLLMPPPLNYIKYTCTNRPNKSSAISILILICFIFFYVFILRRHVSGVFMSCDCRAVRDFKSLV